MNVSASGFGVGGDGEGVGEEVVIRGGVVGGSEVIILKFGGAVLFLNLEVGGISGNGDEVSVSGRAATRS